MIDRYLRFPVPKEEDLKIFSDTVSLDYKNRIRLPAEVKKILSQDLFDILVFHDREVPYLQIVPHDFYIKSYKCFLDHWQKWLFTNDDISLWLNSFEEYVARANTIALDRQNRLTIPSLAIDKLSLQSAQKIHMFMSYPYIKIYTMENYNSLLVQYAHQKK